MTDSIPKGAGSIAAAWWRDLNPENGVQTGSQKAALAHLRRAGTPLEAMRETATLRLIQRLPHFDNKDRVAALAGILAWVRDDEDRPVARAVGRRSLDDAEAVMSEGRFRRLLQIERNDELMDAMRRLVRLAGGTVNVRDLSRSVLYWGDGVRKHWIFNYYGVGRAAPSNSSTAPQGDSAA